VEIAVIKFEFEMQKTQNPLRISQESIDLDDIISDLNEGNQRSTQSITESVPSA